MILHNNPSSVSYTFSVEQEEPPRRGVYVDLYEQHWYLANVRQIPVIGPITWEFNLSCHNPKQGLERGSELRRYFNPYEISTRRECLTNQLSSIPGFGYVAVSEQGFVLKAIFTGSIPADAVIPTSIEDMPVVVYLKLGEV